MKIGETPCKSIINSSGIEGVDYAVNPYIGCAHACTYCYAKFMTRWYHKGEKWGSFVDVKKNAKDCMLRDAEKRRRGVILFSSVTDAYQPAEKKYEITRSLLEILVDHDFPVEILTKSSLVTRDLDLLSRFDEVEVGFTITSFDEKVRRAFEPGASPIEERLDALKLFSDAGIPTYAFLGPLLPFVSELGFEDLLNRLASSVGRVIVDRLNIKAGNWKNIEATLEVHYPEILDEFKEASREPSVYYDLLRGKVRRILDERAIPHDILF
ncbi:radical SAM protein [Candidatus Bathyarchaeota archaeon]|nr:radical SAM protein [Candidatus Bathyarchaeota archaeon]MBT4320791.1 radical SAM protein [Candidatus Bathyarchaeota archaeon]MBT4423065.1 radical SAM protein [Candidatus Bathyarchaeota archaeon]MBT6605661.1 radical SAM protein [Candidatus Bathyarchaeota archaeon]MBT7186189.1 radical SAM protein [Candidatus Bathyarchaeota archaeon]